MTETSSQALREELQDFGVPSRKLEGWKYVSLDPLLETSFTRAFSTTPKAFDAKALACHLLPLKKAYRMVTLNGADAPNLSSSEQLPYGVTLKRVGREDEKNLQPLANTNPFVALNISSSEESFVLRIARDVAVTTPIQIALVMAETNAGPIALHPRIVLVAERGSTANIILSTLGLSAERSFLNGVVEVRVEENASLGLVHHQVASPESFHFIAMNFLQSAASHLSFTAAMQGGHTTRNDYHLRFCGEGASAHLRGVGLLTGRAAVHTHLHIDHAVARCTSRQIFKNIVNGDARSEWTSLSVIHKGAVLSDSDQLNRNIVLSERARAITRPQLRVFNEDVKANHGATIGELDTHELFYLRSRGLSQEQARAILLHGFAEEALENVKEVETKKLLDQFIARELCEVTAT